MTDDKVGDGLRACPSVELPLTYNEIAGILPHRYPFLLVDRIIELELSKRVVGIKNVTINEPFFQGHFPGEPIMPGVLIIEAMAQAGGIMARLSIPGVMEKENPDPIRFVAMDKVKFRKPVVPGDQIRLEIEALRTGSKVWKVAGKSLVDGHLVAEAVMVATIG
ncbi:MAG: 3-hydroxyacyl-ACP dehydratase FabZ [Desulfosarcina sp.]|nr:3-hydroxyacyl-ACP dehydratase FabZ [Desulfobacterales bacterium]